MASAQKVPTLVHNYEMMRNRQNEKVSPIWRHPFTKAWKLLLFLLLDYLVIVAVQEVHTQADHVGPFYNSKTYVSYFVINSIR